MPEGSEALDAIAEIELGTFGPAYLLYKRVPICVPILSNSHPIRGGLTGTA
jgi:hypothetical protein